MGESDYLGNGKEGSVFLTYLTGESWKLNNSFRDSQIVNLHVNT